MLPYNMCGLWASSLSNANLSSKAFPQTAEEANSLFNEGVQLYNDSRFDDALPKFTRAAEIYLKLGLRHL